MNPRQKSYDSFDKTNKLLKARNTLYLNRNLAIIKNRQSQYNKAPLYFKTPNSVKKKQSTLFETYYVKKQNESIKNKLNKILLKPIKPKMNDYFLTKEVKMQKVRQLHKNIFNKKREEDNEYYKNRIKNQKAFINPKVMDHYFNTEHVNVIKKLKKIKDNENMFLPQIKTSSDNPSVFDFHKFYNTTESVMRSKKDDDSVMNKMKSKDGSFDSKTNSEDK